MRLITMAATDRTLVVPPELPLGLVDWLRDTTEAGPPLFKIPLNARALVLKFANKLSPDFVTLDTLRAAAATATDRRAHVKALKHYDNVFANERDVNMLGRIIRAYEDYLAPFADAGGTDTEPEFEEVDSE